MSKPSREQTVNDEKQLSFGDQPGCLALAATPIGNLNDISPRLVKTLSEADLVAAEDTRRTIKLLNHLDIQKKLISYHAHNWKTRRELLLSYMLDGAKIVLVSDAGMPAVSDPGNELVVLCAEHEIPVTVIPGPCAAVTGLAGSGLAGDRFVFEGFIPVSKKERKARLTELAHEKRTLVFYEAPHRLKKTLQDLMDAGFGQRKLTLARELTKKHETFTYTTVEQAILLYQTTAPRGEFVLIMEGSLSYSGRMKINLKSDEVDHDTLSAAEALQAVQALIDEGVSVKNATAQIARQTGLRKNQLYQMILETKRKAASDD